MHDTISRLALFRQSRKPHFPFAKQGRAHMMSDDDHGKHGSDDSAGDAEEAQVGVDFGDIKQGVTQAIHVQYVDVRSFFVV